MSATISDRYVLEERTRGLPHGAVTQGDWKALRRTLFDVYESFNDKPAPGLLVEVGTLGGKTTCGIFEVLGFLKWEIPDVMTIDTEAHCLGDRLKNQCRNFKNTLRTFNGTSPDWECVDPIWWGFIDGCHCHDCVLADLRHLSKFVPSGGIICLHDAGEQRNHGMLVHERYHNKDGVKRLYGVTSAIDEWDGGEDQWERVENVPAKERPKGSPTPLFGGLQAFRKE